MRSTGSYRPSRRLPGGRAVLHLVLAVFVLRALLPVGYMPSFGAGAGFIEICTPQGIERLALDADGRPAEPHSQAVEHPCPYGVVTGALALSAEPASLAAPHVFAPQAFAAPAMPAVAVAPAPRHRPRAPPALV